MLWRLRIGAHQQHLPLRALREAGPHLLPVDDERIAIANGAHLEARQIGSRAGFRIALAPDFLAGEHRLEILFLLLLGAHQHDGGADAIDGELVGAVKRQAHVQHFVLVDGLLDEVCAAAAPFFGPVQRDVVRHHTRRDDIASSCSRPRRRAHRAGWRSRRPSLRRCRKFRAEVFSKKPRTLPRNCSC